MKDVSTKFVAQGPSREKPGQKPAAWESFVAVVPMAVVAAALVGNPWAEATGEAACD